MFSTKVAQFVMETVEKCQRYGVKLTLLPTADARHKDDPKGSRFSGYFLSDLLEMCVAVGHEDWFGVFVHVSCHLDQWTEGKFEYVEPSGF